MILSLRPMQAEDVPQCVEIIANNPTLGPRYASVMEVLPRALIHLLATEAHQSRVLLAGEGADAPVCVVGISAFVRDDFIDDLKKPPHFWIGAELTKRIVSGQSPLLSERELRHANSRGGLNMVLFESCIRPGYEVNGELLRHNMSAFIEGHRGYLWKEIVSPQHENQDHLLFVLRTGGRLWDPNAACYRSTPEKDIPEMIRRPHVVGVRRDMNRVEWAGSWVGALFDYHPPVLGFSPSEQRLLTCAITGTTDEQLAAILGISLSAVKKIWISIHHRVEDRMPSLLSRPSPSGTSANGRGKEKRRSLLSWLRDHPEELRPFSRKLLKENAGPRIGVKESKGVAGGPGL